MRNRRATQVAGGADVPDGASAPTWHRRVLDTLADAVVTLDAAGIVTYVNDAGASLLGRPSADLLGVPLHELVHHTAPDGTPLTPDDCSAPCCRSAETVGLAPMVLGSAAGPSVAVEVAVAAFADGGAALSMRATDAADVSGYYNEVLRLTARERAQRDVMHQLQEAVQPPKPTVAGVELGVHYLSADPSEPTGGDLYDWQVLPNGDLHLVVLDVIGKGVAATKDALAVVHALRVLVLEGCPMDRVVGRADELIAEGNPELVATLVVGRYTPATGRLILAGGGHPPVLVVSPTGDVREVSAPGIPIGWPEAGSFELVEVDLGRSDTAIFYTDGLIEARHDILAGLADLKAAAGQTVGYPADHLARVLIERAQYGAQRHDDSLALVVRRRAAPSGAGVQAPLGRFEHRFSPSLAAVPVARSLLAEWLRRQQVDEREVADQLVVASELCTNAVRSATGAPRGIVLRAWAEGSSLVTSVEDDGPGFPTEAPRLDEIPLPDQVAGRGLFIVGAIVDDLVVESGPAGTLLRATKHCVFPERSR